jgi:hypothetical protein
VEGEVTDKPDVQQWMVDVSEENHHEPLLQRRLAVIIAKHYAARPVSMDTTEESSCRADKNGECAVHPFCEMNKPIVADFQERLASVEVDRDIAEKALGQTRERLLRDYQLDGAKKMQTAIVSLFAMRGHDLKMAGEILGLDVEVLVKPGLQHVERVTMDEPS